MPNHVQNRLTFEGNREDIEAMGAVIREEREDGDLPIFFNNIIPMPESLRGHEPDAKCADIAKSVFGQGDSIERHWLEQTMKDQELAEWSSERLEDLFTCMRNLHKHGFAYWYDWSLEHWGTKWGAYSLSDPRQSEEAIFFQTAWSAPRLVIGKLSADFPSVRFTLTYADEDWGQNQGQIVYEAGDIVSEKDWGNGSRESKIRAMELHGHDWEEDEDGDLTIKLD